MFIRPILIIALALVAANCSLSNYNQQIKRADIALTDYGMPEMASRQLVDEVNKTGNEKYLFMLEAGYLLHTAGRYETSNQLLLDADMRIDAHYRSRTKEAGVIFMNDLSRDYIGEDYERVLLNMTIGLNFMKLGKWQEAMVEFRKVNEKLAEINDFTGLAYKQNIMAKYLAHVAAVQLKDFNYAYVELKQIEEISPGIMQVAVGLIDISEKLGYADETAKWSKKYPAARKGRQKQAGEKFVLIYQPGLSPIKQTRGVFKEKYQSFGIDYAVGAMLNNTENPVPKYEKRPYTANKVIAEIYSDNKLIHKLTPILLNDNEQVMINNFEEYYRKNIKRLMTRVADKVQTARVAGYISFRMGLELLKIKDKDAAIVAPIGLTMIIISPFVSGIFANVALGVEKPDLRCWHSLPASYQSAETYLAPGKYLIKMKYYSSTGRQLWQTEIKDYEIQAGQPNILLSRTVH